MMDGLARAGHHVIYCNSRFRGTGFGAADGEGGRGSRRVHQRRQNRLGYQKVVLAGWGGGGSLSVLYQQQAQHADHHQRARPATAPDLTKLDLPAADAASCCWPPTLAGTAPTDRMDGRIHPRRNPIPPSAIPSSTCTNPTTPPNRPTARNSWRGTVRLRSIAIAASPRGVEREIGEGRVEGAAVDTQDEFGFVVHGTMADPRWLDPAVDPNDREPGTCYLGDPQVVNMSPVGLAPLLHAARLKLSGVTTTPAATESTAGATSRSRRGDRQPGRRRLYPSHTRRLYEAIGHPDKELHEISGATLAGTRPARQAAPGRRHRHRLADPPRVRER